MAVIDYPSTLPGPNQVTSSPKVRARNAGLPGAHTATAPERDYYGTLNVSFFFTREQATIFKAWWDANGGYWFNAVWPRLSQSLSVYRILGSPTFNHTYDGAYRISALVELRGASLAVAVCTRDPYFSCGPGSILDWRTRTTLSSIPLTVNSLDQVSPSPAITIADAGAVTYGSQGGRFAIDNSDNSINYVHTKLDPNQVEAYEASATAEFDFAGVSGTGTSIAFFIVGAGSNQAGFNFRVISGVLNLDLSVTVGGGNEDAFYGPAPAGPTIYRVGFETSAIKWYINEVLVRTRSGSYGGTSGYLRLGPVTARASGEPVSVSIKNTLVEVIRPRNRTILTLHAESLLDNSCYAPKTVALVGTAVISTAEKKFRTSSFLFSNPTGSSISAGVSVADHADFDFGTGDFTVDLWAFRTVNTYQGTIFGFTAATLFALYVNTSGVLVVSFGGSGAGQVNLDTGATFPLGVWNYVSVQRRGVNFEVWLNGYPVHSVLVSGGMTSSVNMSSSFYLGTPSLPSTFVWNGYIDEARVTRGVSRQKSLVDLPTAANPNGNVLDVLLLHFEGSSFVDSSTNLKTLTAFGNAQLSSLKFKYGSSSGLFDGSGDYVKAGNHADYALGTGDFTIECWFFVTAYPTSSNNYGLVAQALELSDQAFVLYVAPPASTNRMVGVVWTSTGSTLVSSPEAPNLGVWNHVALVRKGNFLSLLLNGSLGSKVKFTGSIITSTQPIDVGTLYSGSGITNSYMNGYIDEVRITKGLARYEPYQESPKREACDTA